jgi:hypothetical protein
MSATWAKVEDELIALFASLKRPGGYLQVVEAYHGELDAAQGEEEIRKALVGRVPAVLVSIDGTETVATSLTRSVGIEMADVILHLCSGSQRSADARFRGAVNDPDPGLYKIREDVRGLMLNARIASAGAAYAGEVKHLSSAVVFRRPDLVVLRESFQVPIEFAGSAP